MCRYLQVVVVLFIMGQTVNATAEPDYRTEVARLRELAQTKSPSNDNLLEAKTILARLKTQAPKGAHDLSESLLAIVQTQNEGVIGPLVVPVLCEKADPATANKLIEIVSRLVADLRTHPPSSADRGPVRASAIVNAFFKDGAEPVASIIGSPRILLDAVIDSVTSSPPLLRPDVKQKALLVIAKSPLDRSLRKEYAIRYMSSLPQEPAPAGFAELFSSDDFPKLRELVRSSINTPDSFCFGAAGVLAHHGDEDALPDLKAFLDRHAAGKSTPEGMIKWNIWQIENQRPPAKLLEYIRGTDQRAGEAGRIWAMERAIELKNDKQAIRDAILAHANAMKESAGPNYSLSSLKKAAIDCGVLNANDLPGVAVAQGTPTP